MRYMRWILGAGLALGTGLAVVALAPAEGDASQFCITCGSTTSNVNVKFTGYSVENAGTIGSGAYGGGGISSCSAASGGGTCTETTWAAGFINEVDDLNSNTLWVHGAGGLAGHGGTLGNQRVAFLIVGVADEVIQPLGGGKFAIYNVGANNTAQTADYGVGSQNIGTGQDGKIHVLLYSYTGSDPLFGPSGVNPTDRTGFESVNGITNILGSDLMADFQMKPGIVTPGTVDQFSNPVDNADLFQPSAGGTTQPTTSSGNFYADCITGYACGSQFNNGGMPNAPFSSVVAALFGSYTLNVALSPQSDLPTCTPGDTNCTGWTGAMNDPARLAVTTPEPASMALLGSALIGFGAAARRRRRKNSNA